MLNRRSCTAHPDGPFPPRFLVALTAGATGIICSAVACGTVVAYTSLRSALRKDIRSDIHTIVTERMKPIEDTTHRIVSVEHEVLREIQYRNGDRHLN